MLLRVLRTPDIRPNNLGRIKTVNQKLNSVPGVQFLDLNSNIKEGEEQFYDYFKKLKTHNECRNPDNDKEGKWCFVKSPNIIKYCASCVCKNGKPADNCSRKNETKCIWCNPKYKLKSGRCVRSPSRRPSKITCVCAGGSPRGNIFCQKKFDTAKLKQKKLWKKEGVLVGTELTNCKKCSQEYTLTADNKTGMRTCKLTVKGGFIHSSGWNPSKTLED